jgi:hypothetical protein
MTSRQIVPALVIPFIAWRIYMRARRNIGRQPFKPARLQVSIAVFSTVLVVFAYFGLPHPVTLLALAGGLAVSVALAGWGLHLTKFEDTPQGKFYTPNTALGLAVTALFIGRILYRMIALSTLSSEAAAAMPQPFQSPLTFFLFGVSAGYYIAYAIGVLIRSHRPAPPRS